MVEPRLHPTRSAGAMRLAAMASLIVLAGCASGPTQSPVDTRSNAAANPASPDRDGPEARPPANLAQTPDAEPRLETVRPGGANKPYQALGHDYVPITGDPPFTERGLASWYGRKFQGRRTASGEPYDMYAMTAAHPTLPIPSYARIRNPANGREVVVRINDRGPFHSGRIVDLSYTAALKLDVLRGVAPVELERITYDEVRSGAWKRGGSNEVRVVAKDAVPVPVPSLSTTGSTSSGPSMSSMPSGLSVPPVPPVPSVPSVPSVPARPSGPVAAASMPTPAVTTPSISPATADAVDPPRIEPDSARTTASPTPVAGIYVQLGAFRERDGAEVFQRRVLADAAWLAPLLAVFADSAFYRLQAGPYPSRAEAARAADRMRADLQLVPLIVERH